MSGLCNCVKQLQLVRSHERILFLHVIPWAAWPARQWGHSGTGLLLLWGGGREAKFGTQFWCVLCIGILAGQVYCSCNNLNDDTTCQGSVVDYWSHKKILQTGTSFIPILSFFMLAYAVTKLPLLWYMPSCINGNDKCEFKELLVHERTGMLEHPRSLAQAIGPN